MKKFAPVRLAPWLGLLLAMAVGGLARAQDAPAVPAAPDINRNPAYRDQLPPNPVPPASPRDTVVPKAGPDDPRDSDTRPVLRPGSRDGRDASAPPPTSTGPTNPAPAAPDNTRR